MLGAVLNILGLGLFLLLLGALFFVSIYVAVILFGVMLAAYLGLRVWAYLVEKKIVNPRPGHPIEPDVIDVEFTRVDTKIEKKD